MTFGRHLSLTRVVSNLGRICLSASLFVGCASRQDVSAPDDTRPTSLGQLRSCEALMQAFGESVGQDASESALEELRSQLTTLRPTCEEAWTSQAASPLEKVVARHRSRGMTLAALEVELMLDHRFDGDAYACEIQREIFAELIADLRDLEEATRDPDLQSEEDLAVLEGLRELNLESADLLYLRSSEGCL